MSRSEGRGVRRVGIGLGVVLAVLQSAAAAPVDYARDVKPLLVAKCAACHGALKQQSGLRLDASQLLRRGGDSGPVVIPGNPAKSPLWQRLTETDAAARMPPEAEGEPLTAAQLDVIRSWIEQGASAPESEPVPEDPRQHWSYRPVLRSAIPAVNHPTWARTPIDNFIAAEMEQQGLAPRREASRELWLRRVFLDLIGLPPSAAEWQAFLSDDRPDAYERVVDQLLERPEYGERWGRHWMDVWRYSDWYGSRGINEIRYSQRHIWRWRDWVVESLNADRPYDRMLVEMLAGDEAAPHDPNVLRATGYLGRNWYKFDRNVWLFETVEQTGQAFLGMTLRCARCHDHKFDPITQEDYYRFRAFFEPHDVRTDPLAAGTPTEKDATLGPVLKDGVARVFDKDVAAKTFLFQRGDSRSPDESRPMIPGVPVVFGSEVIVEPVALTPEAYYPSLRPHIAEGLIAAADATVVRDRQKLADAERTVFTAEATLTSGSSASDPPPAFLQDDFRTRSDIWNVASGDWTWADGKLVLSTVGNFATIVTTQNHPRDFSVRVRYRTLAPGQYRSVGFSFDQNGTGESQDVYTSVNDNAPSVQAFHRRGGKHEYPAAGIVKTPMKVGEEITLEATVRGSQLVIRLSGEQKLDYALPVPRKDGKFALWVHSGAAEFLEVELKPLVPTRADLERAVQTARDHAAVGARQVSVSAAESASLRARFAAERAKHFGAPADDVKSLATAAVLAEKHVAIEKTALAVLQAEQQMATVRRSTNSEPKVVVTDAEKKLAAAHRAAATVLESLGETYATLGDVYPATSSGRRLALAKWIATADNPRTSRVAVNHLWLRHFGQGLVATPSNFGLNGQRPTHPELLDWLASEFVANGWRMKPLHRMIVLSATYRQSSSPVAASAWSTMTAAEQLDPANRWLWRKPDRRMEAEVVRDTVLAIADRLNPGMGGPEIPEGDGLTNPRRSLYFRLTPNEKMGFLETFDAADPNGCDRRKESVVPHQALALMNSGLAMDSARALAETLSAATPTDDATARHEFILAAYTRVLSRRPTEAELSACLAFLDEQSATLVKLKGSSFPAGTVGQRAPSTTSWQRARENLIHVLLNHNDFVTIR
jgi:mono/diheme cytochrome c family protein